MPGPALHGQVRNELKGRQLSKLTTVASDPVFIAGIRADESDDRAQMGKGQTLKRSRQLNPVFELTKTEAAQIILEHPEAPINPLWLEPYFTDCACLANGDPVELIEVEEDFLWFAHRLREYEESAEFNDERGTLGWGGLPSRDRQALKHSNDTAQSMLCGSSCAKRDLSQEIIEAFRERVQDDRSPSVVQEVLSHG